MRESESSVLLSPRWGWVISHLYPRLAPRAVFFRRSAAGIEPRAVISTQGWKGCWYNRRQHSSDPRSTLHGKPIQDDAPRGRVVRESGDRRDLAQWRTPPGGTQGDASALGPGGAR